MATAKMEVPVEMNAMFTREVREAMDTIQGALDTNRPDLTREEVDAILNPVREELHKAARHRQDAGSLPTPDEHR